MSNDYCQPTILFVDISVSNYESLLIGLVSNVEVHVLNSNQDGILQITSILQGRSDLRSIQILSHGSNGSIAIGETTLNNSNLSSYSVALKLIGSSLSVTGDILLYGCNVVQDESGLGFITQLANLTGADVAASNNLTGFGGDWDLEVSTGTIESESAINQLAQIQYTDTLALVINTNLGSINGQKNLNGTGIGLRANPDNLIALQGTSITFTFDAGQLLNNDTDFDTPNLYANHNVYSYDGHYYCLSNASGWQNAEIEAQSFGGHLVTINDANEQNWLTQTFGASANSSTLWIGYTDQDVENDFKWISGDSSTYTNWHYGEPNNWGWENYAHMYSDGTWNDLYSDSDSGGYGIIELSSPPSIAISSVTNATGGTAILNTDGSVTFTPTADFSGIATFDYQATDGTNLSNSASVSVNVIVPPHAPTIGLLPISNIAITQGTAVTPEIADITFLPLTKGSSFSIGGFTVYAMDNATADEVASIFADEIADVTLYKRTAKLAFLFVDPNYGYSTGTASNSTVRFTNGVIGNTPDLMLVGSDFSVSLPEAPILASAGSIPIDDVDFTTSGDSVSVNVVNVGIQIFPNVFDPSNNGNVEALVNLLNDQADFGYTQALNFLTLSVNPNATFSTATDVNWSFDVANIPAFESLLTGDQIYFSYQIEATDSFGMSSYQNLNFLVEGKTQIISVIPIDGKVAAIGVEPEVATIKVQTENGTQVRLFDGKTDVTNKFTPVISTDLSGIQTVDFEVTVGNGYNGTRSLIAKSFLNSDSNFLSPQSTFSAVNLFIPDGTDFYSGTTGNDTIVGSTGSDTLSGGLGDDIYTINDAANVVVENPAEGFDTVHSTVSYTLSANVENLYLDGNAVINGTGNVGKNWLHGNDADNTLDDGGLVPSMPTIGDIVADTLSGGKGNDIYIVHSVSTQVMGETNVGGTADAVQSYVNFTLPKNVENLTLIGILNASGKGNNLANVITGNDGNNILDGGAGTDILIGGDGDDLYIIDRMTDVVSEVSGQGIDTVQSITTYTLPENIENLNLMGLATISGTGNSDANIIMGNDAVNTLNGGAGNDVLRGKNGNDILLGGVGSDTLIGGVGVDTLTSGTEADTFMFEALTDMGIATRRDVITDFNHSEGDKIDLSGLITGTFISKATSAFDAINQIHWSFYGSVGSYYAVVQGNVSGDITPEFEIKLTGVTALADTDFNLDLLQQAGTAMLAQANQSGQSVMTLLR
ncbi:MAG: DUF4347 domain-containing protein [Methylococcaceae bacterium]